MRQNTAKLEKEYTLAIAESRNMKFEKGVYGSSSVKAQLIIISYGKCSYCDSHVVGVAYGDVEHFRPKAHYWWLAYTWENLLFSCQICNQEYKRTNFPVVGSRANKPTADLTLEQHLLINPLDEDPEQLIAYDFKGDEAKIIEQNLQVKDRVDACKKYLGLNREDLLHRRRGVLRILKVWYAFYQDPRTTTGIKDEILSEMIAMANNDSQYAGMVRYYLRHWGLIP